MNLFHDPIRNCFINGVNFAVNDRCYDITAKGPAFLAMGTKDTDKDPNTYDYPD